MKRRNTYFFIYSLIIYLILYIVSLIVKNNFLLNILKPGATLLAYISLTYFADISEDQNIAKRLIKYAYFVWLLCDLVAAIGEIAITLSGHTLFSFYNIEICMYILPRILILIATATLYCVVTRKANRFQIWSDIGTIGTCIATTIWLIFFQGSTNELLDENILKLVQLDARTILALIYMFICFSILGILLIAWFHFQKMVLTIGQGMIMIGIAGTAGLDLLQVINMELIGGNIVIDILYKVSILCVAAGGVLYQFRLVKFQRKNKDIGSKFNGTWMNGIYLLSYPMLTIITVGIHRTIFLYIFIIAFYCVSCLYVKQIAITEELLASEKEYNEKLKIYSNVLEQAPMSVVITDVEGSIQYVNPYFSKVSGYSFKEVLGKNPRILKSEKTPQNVHEKLWINLVGGKKWDGEFINVNKTGEEYEEKSVIIPIKNEHDVTTHYVAIKENVSETKKIKNQITNQNYFTTQILDTLPSAIFYASTSGVFLGANAKFKKISGINSDKLIGIKMSEAFWMTKENYNNFIEMKDETTRTNQTSIRQISRKLEDGKEIIALYSVSKFNLYDGSIGGYLGVMTDITDLKQKEAELEEALKRANDATVAKSQFLANMSHEIRTPMNAIIGMSYLALKTELNPKQVDYVSKIHNAATSLLGIINDILDFSKIESGKMNMEAIEFDLDKVITNSIGLLAPKAYEKHLEFLYHLPFDIPHNLIGDPLRLGQIITNLVGNAIKFTESGEIAVDISKENYIGNKIQLKFSIRDTGIGISEKNLNKLFESFTQSDSSTTRKFGGTGLGLTISKKLTEMMGGTLYVESEYGKGSTFVFTAWFECSEKSYSNIRLIPKGIQNMKVLVVDDNSVAREILQEYLNAMGFIADAVSSGEEALDTLMKADKKGSYHVAFIDWQMKEMNGIQIAEKIKKGSILENIPEVVLVTAFDKEDMIKKATNVNVNGFLAKPISQSTLYDTIIDLFSINTESIFENSKISEKNYYLSGLKVLLAEDNQVNQQIAVELLTCQGIVVDVASNGLEAVEKVKGMPQDDKYDIVLMDLQMPEIDGFEASRRIRGFAKEMPIIAMTARTMLEEKEKCYEVGMNDHVAKPIDPHNLFTTILRWVDSEKLKLWTEKPPYFNRIEEMHELNISGIDTKSGLIRVANNMELYLNLLQKFTENQNNNLNMLSDAINKNDFISIEKLTHTLKGVSGNIGAVEIQLISEKLEKLAKTSQDKDEILQLFGKLSDSVKKVIEGINLKLIDQERTDNEFDMADFEINDCSERLIAMLEDCDSEAVEYFNSIKSGLKKVAGNSKILTLEKYIKQYEFEDAIQLIKGINIR